MAHTSNGTTEHLPTPVQHTSDDPAVVELLAVLDAAAKQHNEEQAPVNTQRAYNRDWRVWKTYTDTLGIPETSCSPGALVAFVVYLERQGAAPTTIDRRLAGVVVGLRKLGVEPTKHARMEARKALDGYETRLAQAGEKRGRGKAPAMQIKHLRRMVVTCDDSLAGKRDRALVLIGFAIAGRRSETASLLVSDIRDDENGLVVNIRFGKTGSREVAVPRGTSERTCPVRAWHTWKAAAGITDGPAFRHINQWGHMRGGLSGQAVGNIITRVGQRAGVEVRFTGHSSRSGMITESRRAGHDPKTIGKTSGHVDGSRVLMGYMQIVDRWTDNALEGIGL